MVSLSTHSVMEGLVVGLEQTSDHVWTLFIAVALQKFILTFCVCLELQESGVKTFIFLSYLTVVSLVSPLVIKFTIIIKNIYTVKVFKYKSYHLYCLDHRDFVFIGVTKDNVCDFDYS